MVGNPVDFNDPERSILKQGQKFYCNSVSYTATLKIILHFLGTSPEINLPLHSFQKRPGAAREGPNQRSAVGIATASFKNTRK
jgi:hypothetical protein